MKRVMDCKYLGIGHLDDKTPCWICKREFVGMGSGEIIRDQPTMEFVCKRCHWYEKSATNYQPPPVDRQLKLGGARCQKKSFVVRSLLFIFCSLLFTVFSGCEKHKDRVAGTTTYNSLIVGSDFSPATSEELEIIANLAEAVGSVYDLTGGDLTITESHLQELPAKAPNTYIEDALAKIIKGLKIQRLDEFLKGGGVFGILSFAYSFMELTDTSGSKPIDEIVNGIAKYLTGEQLYQLRQISADSGGWFLESVNSTYGLAIYTKITLINGMTVSNLEDMVRVIKEYRNKKIIKTLAVKIVTGQWEVYIIIDNPYSKTPAVLYELWQAELNRKMLSSAFTFDRNSKTWITNTITKYDSVGNSISYSVARTGVDWLIVLRAEGKEYERVRYNFSYDSGYWSGTIRAEYLDTSQDPAVWVEVVNKSFREKGLLSIFYLISGDIGYYGG